MANECRIPRVPRSRDGGKIALRGVVAVLIPLVEIAIFFAIAYRIVTGPRFGPRTVAALLCAGLGLFAFYEGVAIAKREDDRARYGRATPGIVIEKLTSLESRSTQYAPIGRRRRSNPIGDGFILQQRLARLIATGSARPWVIVYRYTCSASACSGRDLVTEASWSELQVGQTVNIREIVGEADTRLEDNPQWPMALSELGLAVVFLFGARLLSGRPFFPQREWITAPAVVLRVEPVTYPDATRWRIHFAYFDPAGQAQESADEVVTGTWKPGDDCIAVFRPKAPDLATLRPWEESSSATR